MIRFTLRDWIWLTLLLLAVSFGVLQTRNINWQMRNTQHLVRFLEEELDKAEKKLKECEEARSSQTESPLP